MTWSSSAFANANALYAVSWAYDSTFSDYSLGFNLVSNAQNLTYYQYAGGVTINPTTAPSPPYASSEYVSVSNDGTPGSWGWSYDTAAGPSGSLLTSITYGSLGGLATLNFDVGGGYTINLGGSYGYYVYVYLPGDWATAGTGTGDHIYNSVGSGFSTPTFSYDPGTKTTTVFTDDLSFTTGYPSLNFTLVGSAPVPEPSTWAMMLAGFAGLGFAGWRAANARPAVA